MRLKPRRSDAAWHLIAVCSFLPVVSSVCGCVHRAPNAVGDPIEQAFATVVDGECGGHVLRGDWETALQRFVRETGAAGQPVYVATLRRHRHPREPEEICDAVTAIEALRLHGDPTSKEILEETANDPLVPGTIRRRALLALGELPGKDVVELLGGALSSAKGATYPWTQMG